MKNIWMIVSTLAIANLLAIIALLGWLHSSDRLSRQRIEAIRSMLSVSVAQEAAAEAQKAAEAAAEQQRAEAEARQAVPPVTAADRIAERQLEAEKQLQVVLRQRQELENLREGLMKQLADLERREQALAARAAAFEAEQKRIAETEGAEQFKIALATLENQRPKDAQAVLQAMLNAGDGDQVVSYLNRMDESKRAKVLAEFVKIEPTVAADLLERLRTRGLTPPADSALEGASAGGGSPTPTAP